MRDVPHFLAALASVLGGRAGGGAAAAAAGGGALGWDPAADAAFVRALEVRLRRVPRGQAGPCLEAFGEGRGNGRTARLLNVAALNLPVAGSNAEDVARAARALLVEGVEARAAVGEVLLRCAFWTDDDGEGAAPKGDGVPGQDWHGKDEGEREAMATVAMHAVARAEGEERRRLADYVLGVEGAEVRG